MQQFAQQVVGGLALGAVYASLALALVLIHRTTHVVNFAQGEMAMFTTFIAWSLNNHMAYWPAFVVTLAIAFVGGVLIHRALIRPVEEVSPLAVVMVTIAILVILNGLAAWIWSAETRNFPTPFPGVVEVGGVTLSRHELGVIGVTLVALALLWAFFRYTRLGLAMRAAAIGRNASRLLGVRVGWMLALGWGFAAMLGAVSGMMVAPVVLLDPTMMLAVLTYAFAAAVLGGIDSPLGAVVGGLSLGLAINLLNPYVDFVTPGLKLPLALGVLLAILLIRPWGLFGRPAVLRV